MPTEAFSETLQFIANAKNEELEKRRQKYVDHFAKVSAEANAHGNDLIARLSVLIEGLKAWPGACSANFDVRNIQRWLETAKRDPGFPCPMLQEWINQAEAQMNYEKTRYDYARFLTTLHNEWLDSCKDPDQKAIVSDEVIDVDLSDMLKQREDLEALIFEDAQVDIPALESYLHDLFSSKEAKYRLESIRERMKNFSAGIQRTALTVDEMNSVISSVLKAGILSKEKQATLKEFQRNSSVIEELTRVLNFQREAMHFWHWPQCGVPLEPSHHRSGNGKARYSLDTEILTCLLLQYLGSRWAMEFRSAFYSLSQSTAWKKPAHALTRSDYRRRETFIPSPVEWTAENIDDKHENGKGSEPLVTIRRSHRQEQFFMCRIPDQLKSVYTAHDLVASPGTSGPVSDTTANSKRLLLHIVGAETLLNKAMYGQGTVVRTDLKWFDASLPHETILTVLRFFGMPEEDLNFVQSFLSCPIVFKDDPSGQVRIRKRGVPSSDMLSILCEEVSLFIMDIAVNQRADGLSLHRVHDNFWFWDRAPEACAAAWKEMKKYAALAGLNFNQEKTGSICVGAEKHPDLPRGDVRWGFLKMDGDGGFVIDQAMVDAHTIELRHRLDATTSVFGWSRVYSNYVAFVIRNCGNPAFVHGKAHIDAIIDSITRMQQTSFPGRPGGTGGFVGTFASMLESRFGMRTSDIPLGFYLWPRAAGGLSVRDPFVPLFLMRDQFDETPEDIISKTLRRDETEYAKQKRKWEDGEADRTTKDEKSDVSPTDPFMSFEEYIKGREECLTWWGDAYTKLLRSPAKLDVTCTPELEAAITNLGSGIRAFGVDGEGGWNRMHKYWRWVIGMHHREVIKKFGSLAIVDPDAVPMGRIQ